MKAGIVTGKRQLELREFPQPQPEPGKVVVQIAYCGICGTDLHAYQSGAFYNPAICGHEWSGTVSAARRDVSVREGDRVAIGIAGACGVCQSCQRGDHEHCDTAFAGLIGTGPLAAPHGGFASAISIDAARLYRVWNSIDDRCAAMLEPAAIALHAVRRTPIRLGDCVAVIGAGPIGLLIAQCAHAAGAGAVVVVETQAARRALAETLGADLVIDPSADDSAERIAEFTGRSGADVVFECAGIPTTIDTSVGLCRRGGVVSLVGVPNAPSTIHGAGWLVKEIRLTTSLGYLRHEFDLLQGLVSDGRIELPSLHTSTVGLSGLAAAFDTLSTDPSEVKILMDPNL
jgi:(R,R)-butanediol dehydrogenase/meso-butanediol dehydrogenase/diacetyl reductase